MSAILLLFLAANLVGCASIDVKASNEADERAMERRLEDINDRTPAEAVAEVAKTRELSIQLKLCSRETNRLAHPERNIPPQTREQLLASDAHLMMHGGDVLKTVRQLKEDLAYCNRQLASERKKALKEGRLELPVSAAALLRPLIFLVPLYLLV